MVDDSKNEINEEKYFESLNPPAWKILKKLSVNFLIAVINPERKKSLKLRKNLFFLVGWMMLLSKLSKQIRLRGPMNFVPPIELNRCQVFV